MAASSDFKQRKLHVNLTLRADLYGVAQDHAKDEGLSVSAFIERLLLSLAKDAPRPGQEPELDPELSALGGILKGPPEGWSNQEARAIRHEGRLAKGGK